MSAPSSRGVVYYTVDIPFSDAYIRERYVHCVIYYSTLRGQFVDADMPSHLNVLSCLYPLRRGFSTSILFIILCVLSYIMLLHHMHKHNSAVYIVVTIRVHEMHAPQLTVI